MKKTLIIISIVLLSILSIYLLYLAITAKEKYFNKVTIDTENTIVNGTKEKYLDTIVYAGLKSLNLKNLNVVILPMSNNTEAGIEFDAYVVEFSGSYYIYIRDYSRQKSIDVLSHELIHVSQYRNKNLIIKNDMLVLWNDSIYDGHIIAYENRPWEIDAFDRQSFLATKIRTILYE